MQDPKSNEYGMVPKYEVGDEVKIWLIYKNPTGVVESIVDPNAFPIKYVVRYRYFTGDVYVEAFNQDDLTLVKRKFNFYCSCQTVTDKHATWCNKYNTLGW